MQGQRPFECTKKHLLVNVINQLDGDRITTKLACFHFFAFFCPVDHANEFRVRKRVGLDICL